MLAEQHHSKHYLVLDDFKSFRSMMKGMLNELGVANIDLAANASGAMRLCKENLYDVILADYNLGEGKNGQQFLEELHHLKLIKQTTIFIMVTAEVDKDIVLAALECQPNGYIAKPFTSAVLNNRLDRLLQQTDQIRDVLVAMDKGDLQGAIHCCDAHINSASPYANVCLKIKGDLLMRLKNYEGALELYQGVLDSRELDWALLGLGQAYYESGEYVDACKVLTKLVKTNMNLLSAYDWLAKSLQAMGEAETAQKILHKAVTISSRSIPRQQFFAEICHDNNDMEEAANAYRKVLSLSSHSVHNSADNGLNLARCLTEAAATASKADAERLVKEALGELDKVSDEFDLEEVALQAKLIEARAYCANGQKFKGEEKLREASSMSESLGEEMSADLKLEFARTYSATDNKIKETDILKELAIEHGEDEKIASQIDKMLDEPITTSGKKKARLINKKGVELYNAKNYAAAVVEFERALKQSPKSVAFSLNMLHALISQIESQGDDEELAEKCKTLISGSTYLPRDHKHFKWYRDLCKKFAASRL